LQLYFDFSGYSDMAMGLSLMFNVHLPLNFDSPYKARSIIDFWRRWHMTLSQFLRDYLYIALGGNRRGVLLRYLFLMITMLLGGLWHGAAWNFVLWGGLHGIYLIVNHSWRNWWRWGSLPSLCGGLLTYVAVVVAWVFFRANDVPSALYVLNSMFVDYVPSTERWVAVRDAIKYILLGSIIVWCIPSAQQLAARWKNTGFSAWRGLLLAILFLLCVDRLNQVSEFLYFRF
jgi:D-alanyl-lipoteichoic acid acyltransferase DltB (MBOAT superfamily)